MKELKLGRNIARNTALSENVFMMLVCIELRIPLFVVGKPGSSKSLAKTVVADNMQGEQSTSELFKNFKQVSQKFGSPARFVSLHSFIQLGIIQPSILQYINITDPPRFDRDQAPLVQKLDRAIHWIKIYPVDNAIDLRTTHRLDSAIQRLKN